MSAVKKTRPVSSPCFHCGGACPDGACIHMAQNPEPERVWYACALVREGTLFRWAKVALPESVVRAHLVSEHPPDLRSRVTPMIENELHSEGIVTGRGWEVKR